MRPHPAETTPPDTPPRLHAEARREQLIDVAIDLFSRRGFKGTTTKEIASAAGVTEAIIFRHFATKEQLYTAILERRQKSGKEVWLKALQDRMEANDDEGIFREILTKIVCIFREDAKFERVMLYAALEGHEIAAMYHKQFALQIIEILREYIARRQREGGLREMNPSAVIFALAGMAQQYGMHTHLCEYHDAGFTDEQAVETFTQIILGGVLAHPKEKQ